MKKNIYQTALAAIAIISMICVGGESDSFGTQVIWSSSWLGAAFLSGYLLNKSIEKEDEQ